MIMDGGLVHLPEAAFKLNGAMEEVIEAGDEKLAEV